MFLRIVLSLFIVAEVFLCSVRAEEDPILAKAGDSVFRQSDLDRMLSYSPPLLQQQLKENPPMKTELVKRIMEQKILSDIARKEGFDKKPHIREQLQYVEDGFLYDAYLSEVVMNSVKVSDDDVKKYYADHEKEFIVPEQVSVKHILIRVPFGASAEEKKKAKEKMNSILEWLKRGEKFGTLAEQYSEDPKSKTTGGSLGYITRGQMPKSFEDAAFALKPGQISDVVETDYGYHIITVEDHKKEMTRAFDEVKNVIREQLTENLTRSKVDEFRKNALKDAGLEIYPEKIEGKVKK